ncbi:MAG TPA: AAA family ATPase, partial [Candidatus Tectomicrobia bacterium]
MLYVFGDYTLDTQGYALSRAGASVHVRPKVFQVLAYLLAHRDRVVPKPELMEQVWPGQAVSDETLDSCIALARRAVGDSARVQAVIQTRHGFGHRFVAAVEVRDYPSLADAATAVVLAFPESQADAALASVPVPTASLVSRHTPHQRLLAGEQKLVTVLVCTLAQAAAWAQRLEAEVWHQALQAFFAASLEEIQRYGGTLQHLRDDGLLVLFGAPVAQEDHARRAVRAALGLQQRLRRVHVDAAWPLDEACVVCQGLHTGRMLLGSLGDDGRLTYTAVGDTTQRATWLAQQAAPGTILLSDATARLVQGEVRMEACTPVPHLGPTDPSPTYQVLGLGPHRTPLLTDGVRPRSRFVGRKLELATLQALLARVAEGQGQVVGIVGEPGMGKTRLLAEFRQRLGDTRVTYLEGQCVSYGQATPYKPVQDLLRHACGCTEADRPAAITANVQQHLQAMGMAPSDAVPFLLHLLGMPDDAALLVGRSPQEIRTQTFAVLHQLLLQESQRQPLLVVVENLHWIDPTSQAYLVELVERLANVPLLLLVTFRPGYRPPWMEKSYATQLALPRLGPEDSRCVMQAVLHPTPVPEALMQDLLTKAAGNPFFLEELAWTVREHGDFRLPPEVPDTIRAVLAARIDWLPPEAKQVLQTAAVIGTEVPVRVLQALTMLSEETLWQRLHDLHTAEFLYEMRPSPDRTYVFKHVLTQEAAYQSLLKRTRQEVHQRIAQVLEAAFPETAQQQPELLALHYTEAGLNARAVGYWQRAGQRANERSAHVEAIMHLTRGLDVLTTLPDTAERRQHELGLQSALGLALTVTKGWAAPEVEHAYTRARELCQQVDETLQLFPVLIGLRGFYTMRGDLRTSRELGEQLLRLAQCGQDPALLSAAHYALGAPVYFLGELVLARVHLEQGVALYNLQQPRPLAFPYDLGEPGVLCLSRVALTLWYLGYPDQALERMHETLSLAQDLSRPFSLAWALSFAAIVHQLRREGHVTHARAEALHALSRTQGFAAYVVQGTLLRGWAVAMQGHGAEGIAQLQEGLAANRARQEALMRPYWLTLLADVYGQVGQAEHGLAVLAEALAIVHSTGQHVYEAELHRLRGELLLQSGV